MKVWKLVSGILSIVFSLVVLFQSCAAGVVDALESNDGVSGAAGTMVALLMIAGGVVSIATRNAEKKGGNIALIIIFGLACLFGFTMHGVYEDLVIWSCWCLICLLLAVVSMFARKKDQPEA